MRLRHVPVVGLAVLALGAIPAAAVAKPAAGPTFHQPSRADDPSISAQNPKYVNEPATAVGTDGRPRD